MKNEIKVDNNVSLKTAEMDMKRAASTMYEVGYKSGYAKAVEDVTRVFKDKASKIATDLNNNKK